VVLYKGKKTELILRQDCYSFNLLQHLLLHNPGKRPSTLASLLADRTLQETPSLFLLLWQENVTFDCIVFTDRAVLQMIAAAESARAKEAVALINASLHEFATKGTMTYKETKRHTVAHQKVSLFPLRDIAVLAAHPFPFSIKSSDLVFKPIRPDISLWQEIEKAHLKEQIRLLTSKKIEL
jgi:hypothetical protein